MTPEQRMKYLDGEFSRAQAYVLYFHARIVSGVYKQRLGQVFHGSASDPKNAFTEEELLADEVDTMNRHIMHMTEIINKQARWTEISTDMDEINL